MTNEKIIGGIIMKKTELISAIAEQSGLTKKDAEAALTAALDTIVKAVAEGDKVQLSGFGIFEQRQRNARTGVDPEPVTPLRLPLLRFPLSRQARHLRK